MFKGSIDDPDIRHPVIRTAGSEEWKDHSNVIMPVLDKNEYSVAVGGDFLSNGINSTQAMIKYFQELIGLSKLSSSSDESFETMLSSLLMSGDMTVLWKDDCMSLNTLGHPSFYHKPKESILDPDRSGLIVMLPGPRLGANLTKSQHYSSILLLNNYLHR